MSIKEYARDSRPRERAQKYGIATLSEADLLAIVIASGTREQSALGLAYQLLELGHDLFNLSRLDFETLRLKGLGPVKKVLLSAVFELGRRAATPPLDEVCLRTGADFFHQYYSRFCGLLHERFLLVMLDRRARVVFDAFIDSGSSSKINLSYPWLMKTAAGAGAPSAVIMHNHPSGALSPSPADDLTTFSIRQSLLLVGVALSDHLIVTDESYFSYREEQRFTILDQLISGTGK